MSDYSIDDALTDISSVTSFGDISVCEEIGELIQKCEELEQEIDISFQTLKNIHSLVENHNIIVTHNKWIGDFNELLENIHNTCLETITETGHCNFGHILLDTINNSRFH